MTKPRGGHRPNAGALVQSVELSKEDWRTLRTILLARYGKADKETVNIFFAGVIHQEWQAYDEMIQEKSIIIQGETEMLNLKEIAKKFQFQGTPEELAAAEADEKEMEQLAIEQREVDRKHYHSGEYTAEALEGKYGVKIIP